MTSLIGTGTTQSRFMFGSFLNGSRLVVSCTAHVCQCDLHVSTCLEGNVEGVRSVKDLKLEKGK